MAKTTLHFLGGAGSVTGSNFMLESGDTRLLVDCGLFQGCEYCEDANWKDFSFDPTRIPVLIVTHAHIDHIGRIPKLVRDGFNGRIISTAATKALAEPLLLDSMELLRAAAEKHNRPVLYDEQDIAQAMKLWESIPYRTPHTLVDGFAVELFNSSHILGSAMAKISRGGRAILFTGDLGGNSPLLPKRDTVHDIHYLVMESVYGNRDRGDDAETRQGKLEDVIEDTAARGGTLLIPAFSTERTQDLLYEIREMMMSKKVPSMPVYVDSPLASKITAAFLAHPDCFSQDIQTRIAGGEKIFEFEELRFTENAKESQAAAASRPPKILLAGSGMSNGGRVLSHEMALLPDAASTLCIVGYQPAGSLGRQLLEGAKKVKLFGKTVTVNANITAIFGYSAHLDGPHLLDFVSETDGNLEKIFVTMGEPASASFLAQRIRDFLGFFAVTPEAGEHTELEL